MPPRLTATDLARLTGARPREGKPRRRRKQGRPEAALLRQVLQWCALRGIWAERQNAGRVVTAGRRITLGAPGRPDVMLLWRGRAIFLELKAPGGRLRPSQRAWIERAERLGGATVFVIRSLEQLEDALRAEGIIP